MWNQKDLPEPPVISYKTHKQDLDLIKLRNALQEGIKHFKDSKLLSSEAALLSRILYRMKMKFRSAKDFKLLEKLCRSLEIYFSTSMARHLKNILDMTPTRYKLDTYLPTRNMLAYVLVRLQGLVKLMERIYDTCLIAATELNKRFSIGHFWKLFLILFGLVSRISILVKYNTKTLCDLYGKLLPYSHRLENCGNNWLPDGYVLPSDLRAWLSVQWVYEDEFVDLTCEPVNEVMNFFNLVDDDEDDVQFCDEYILLDDEEKQIAKDFGNLRPLKESLSRNRMRGFSINEDDIGEEVTEIIEINDTILDPTHSEDSSARVLNTIHEHEPPEDTGEELCLSISGHPEKSETSSTHAEETIELVEDNGSSNNENCMNKNVIDLVDETTREIEDESVIIVSEHTLGADKTVIVFDDTVIEEPLQASNSNIKKKKKLRISSKENLKEVDLAEMKKDIAQYQTKTEAVAKRKLDFTEAESNKKMRKLNGRSLQLNDIISPAPIKDILCSNNNSSQSDQSLRSTLKKKKKHTLRSQTNGIASRSSNQNHLKLSKKVKKVKSHNQTKRKLDCHDEISNKKMKKTGKQLSRSKENITSPTNKRRKSKRKETVSGIDNIKTTVLQKGDSSKAKLRKMKAREKKKKNKASSVPVPETTQHTEIKNKSSKKLKKKQKQLQNSKTVNPNQPPLKKKKNNSERKRSSKKKSKKPAVLQARDSKVNGTTMKISKTKVQKLKRKVKGTQEVTKLKQVCYEMIKILRRV